MQVYSGTRTDSSRWTDFELRPGDVIVSTPPKCGTTWMMAVIAMLLHCSTELPQPLGKLSPWLDYFSAPLEDILAIYRSQEDRRLIKTHTPLDGLPLVNGTHAIAVLRNPLDAMRSMRRHVSNMVNPPNGDPFLADEDDVILRGIELPFAPTNVDDVSLELLVRHLRAATNPTVGKDRSVTIVHYSDMKRDLKKVVSHVASAIQAHAAPKFLENVVRAASISSMRSKADQFAPLANANHFSSSEKFFAAGEERGHSQLPQHLKARYEERLSELLSPTEANWLKGGGPLPVTDK
ncbi:sulfotransferase domain-containing protein [uncultured Boseongicola sp.]|uniref:sulfotransferase domain-containing protein n=1 Tax=uncultured Boseongicola sp. TaxID=1648499 RepID=UPI002628416A|nr:sulfotransferase domain-containing protein [uncultured Boseongicola sp.]